MPNDNPVEALLSLARSQLGVREDPMGTGNVTYNTAYYGKAVHGSWYAWCCVFQWWLFQTGGLGELFCGGQKTASCTQLYQYYKRKGQTVDKGDIRPGDLVFFVFDGGKSGCMNHVGLCESAGEGYVVTIDGNTGDDEANGGTVARKKRSLRYVGGAARPAYPNRGTYPPEGHIPTEGINPPGGHIPMEGINPPEGHIPMEGTYPPEDHIPIGGHIPGEKEEPMKMYQYVADVPLWARPSAQKAVQNGYIKMDGQGAMALYESSLQPLVWLDRAGLLDAPARKEGV